MLNMKMLSSVINGISMIENIRASGREKALFQQWSSQLAEASEKNLEVQTRATYFNIPPTFFNLINNVLTLCIGAKLVMDGDLTLGGLFAFQTLTASFSTPVTTLLQQNAELQSLRSDVERIGDIYKYKPEKRFAEERDNSFPVCDQLDFEMRNITFGYSKFEEPLIKDFSLKIALGKRVALVGHSGSGKSTIAKLANGTFSPWSGEILLNGKPLSNYTKEEFYSLIGTVDQNIMLFSGTVGENLTLFAPLYDAAVLQKAVRDAAIEEELTSRGDMLQQTVDENGRNFSGGQCQRLEIARTLAQQTPMLILDEATSALDPVTEQQIDLAIRKRQVSCLIVAHRLSTVRDCDEIIMLEKGIVLERGTHQELMQLNGAYAQMMNLEQGGASC
jgi:ABC-type bacteriocin/lantibiotic exporter with double-glycine peptidase domain